MHTDTYLGTWDLIPELCIYEQGEAPRSGVYTIGESEGVVSISMSWTDAEGEQHAIEYGGLPDGSEHPLEAPDLTHMTLTRIDSSTLDSAAYKGEDQMMYARRTAHDDLLTTLQRIKTEDDGSVSIFQVYSRSAA
jgi:hypothetical protein